MRISPGMTHPPSRLYLSDIRHSVPCKFRALTIMAALPRCAASYPLPVRQASALPSASSRFAVTHDTLAVQLTLPLAGRVEDFHLQVSAPCRAHHKNGRISGHDSSTYLIFKQQVDPALHLHSKIQRPISAGVHVRSTPTTDLWDDDT